MEIVVIYHGGCWDGFCAAWLFHKAFPKAEFIPAKHGTQPPDLTGKRVFIADFAYGRDAMFDIASKNRLTVLDHHKTASDALKGLELVVPEVAVGGETPGPTEVVFDMDKSGGRLAWEYLWKKRLMTMFVFATGADPPWLVSYTEDRDLWRWALPNSKEINAALRSYPLEFSEWDAIFRQGSDWFVSQGKAILRMQQQEIDRHVRHAREIEMDGHKVLSVNATTLHSEIAGALAVDRPFGVAYFDRSDGKRQFSLRSTEDGVSVEEIAKAHGGGGHRHAAGFETDAPVLEGGIF